VQLPKTVDVVVVAVVCGVWIVLGAERLAVVLPGVLEVFGEAVEQAAGRGPAEVDDGWGRFRWLVQEESEDEQDLLIEAVDRWLCLSWLVAVTVKLWLPGVEVSIGALSGTGPVHEAIPGPGAPSLQL